VVFFVVKVVIVTLETSYLTSYCTQCTVFLGLNLVPRESSKIKVLVG